jgi:hypothetical protein
MTTATAAADEIRGAQHSVRTPDAVRTRREAVEADRRIDRSSPPVARAEPSVAATRFDEFGFLALVGAAQLGWVAAAVYALTRLI